MAQRGVAIDFAVHRLKAVGMIDTLLSRMVVRLR